MKSFGETVAKEAGELLTPEQMEQVGGGALTVTATVKVPLGDAAEVGGDDKTKVDADG